MKQKAFVMAAMFVISLSAGPYHARAGLCCSSPAVGQAASAD